MDVTVEKMHGFYPPGYMVVVDGKVYDSFFVRNGRALVWAEQCDVANMYAEALDGYVSPVL